jgi:hypothetical protein
MCDIHVIPVHIESEGSTLHRKNAAQITPAHERDTVAIRGAFLGRPPFACPPRHWMRTNDTHACANQANRLINTRFSRLDLQHVVGAVERDKNYN